MSGMSVLFGIEPVDTLWGTMSHHSQVVCVDLLGIKSDVTALNADSIIPG